MRSSRLQQIFSLATCFLMLLAVAINRDYKIGGHEWGKQPAEGDSPIIRHQADGTFVVSTQELAKDIAGYGGNIPLEITVKEGHVTGIKALKNAESPDFFEKASTLFSRWTGLSMEEAIALEVDAVSGATLSSNAIIATVHRGLVYAQNEGMEDTRPASAGYREWHSPKFLCTLLVVLMGAVLPFIVRFRRYRTLQLLLNVAVLGFWSGSFISYSLLVNYLSNGVHLATALISVLLLAVAFLFPLFGKKGHYCAWVCPLGALQELAGKSVKRKLRIPPRTLKFLNYFRDGLWAVLMLMMWTGVCFSWMDYELFTAFLFRQAPVAVVVIAVAFVLLSCVVNRPYCRFVCPTGCFIRLSQNIK